MERVCSFQPACGLRSERDDVPFRKFPMVAEVQNPTYWLLNTVASKFIFIITIENLIIKTDWEQLIQLLFVGSKTFACLL